MAAFAPEVWSTLQFAPHPSSRRVDVSTNDVRAHIDAEKNQLMLEEMRAHLVALRRTSELRRKAEAADLRLLEIQRDRAKNAWMHAQQNAKPREGVVASQERSLPGRR